MLPDDVGRWLWSVVDDAGEVDAAAPVDVHVRSSRHLGSRFCGE